MHTFHIDAANKCAFKGHLIGLEGDEIVLYMKVQSTDELSVTHDKGSQMIQDFMQFRSPSQQHFETID